MQYDSHHAALGGHDSAGRRFGTLVSAGPGPPGEQLGGDEFRSQNWLVSKCFKDPSDPRLHGKITKTRSALALGNKSQKTADLRFGSQVLGFLAKAKRDDRLETIDISYAEIYLSGDMISYVHRTYCEHTSSSLYAL